jgi:hypothetical protein
MGLIRLGGHLRKGNTMSTKLHVRHLTSALFEVLPGLARDLDFLLLMDLERAPATPIPLHRGTAFYYREAELIR